MQFFAERCGWRNDTAACSEAAVSQGYAPLCSLPLVNRWYNLRQRAPQLHTESLGLIGLVVPL